MGCENLIMNFNYHNELWTFVGIRFASFSYKSSYSLDVIFVLFCLFCFYFGDIMCSLALHDENNLILMVLYKRVFYYSICKYFSLCILVFRQGFKNMKEKFKCFLALDFKSSLNKCKYVKKTFVRKKYIAIQRPWLLKLRTLDSIKK